MTKRKTISVCFYGTATAEQYSQALIEVPADATEEEINAIGQSQLKKVGGQVCWDVQDITDIQAHSVKVQGEVNEGEPELRLRRDEDGSLMLER